MMDLTKEAEARSTDEAFDVWLDGLIGVVEGDGASPRSRRSWMAANMLMAICKGDVTVVELFVDGESDVYNITDGMRARAVRHVATTPDHRDEMLVNR